MRFKLMILVTTMWSATSALAQSSVGELLDGGATKLNRDELNALLPGATLTGLNYAGGEITSKYRQDGTLAGRAAITSGPMIGRTTGIVGTWAVADDGKLCTDLSTQFGSRQTCWYLFKLGDRHFLAESDSDRAASILQRTITKP